MTKCWIYLDKILFARNAETADMEDMGKIYDITLEDASSLEDAKQLMLYAEQNYRMLNKRIASKLRREQD